MGMSLELQKALSIIFVSPMDTSQMKAQADEVGDTSSYMRRARMAMPTAGAQTFLTSKYNTYSLGIFDRLKILSSGRD